MKKFITVLLLIFCSTFLFAKGTIIKIKPENFKNSIIIHNETDKELYVYLYVLHENDSKKYKSEISKISAYKSSEIEFDYDDEWHDLVKELKVFFETLDKDSSMYDFEFHFSDSEIIISESNVYDKCFHVYITSSNENIF